MAKSSTLEQLEARWGAEKKAKSARCRRAAGNPSPDRWKEIARVHNLRVIRAGGINRAGWVAMWLADLQVWGEIIRGNRKLTGMPPQITTFGNGGQPKSTRDAEVLCKS